jgi:hypothetical protein
MSDDFHVNEDRMQSALAMTHHIQMRIIQCMGRRRVSPGMADDVAAMCKAISENFSHAAKGNKQ